MNLKITKGVYLCNYNRIFIIRVFLNVNRLSKKSIKLIKDLSGNLFKFLQSQS